MRPIAIRIVDRVDRVDRWITLRNRIQVKILRFRSEDTATIGIHERERSPTYSGFSGPPGSRSRHLGSWARASNGIRRRPDYLVRGLTQSTDVRRNPYQSESLATSLAT
jgi:hypothetical protein